jgi:hypothetical protein
MKRKGQTGAWLKWYSVYLASQRLNSNLNSTKRKKKRVKYSLGHSEKGLSKNPPVYIQLRQPQGAGVKGMPYHYEGHY